MRDHDARDFGTQCGIGGRGESQGRAEDLEFAREFGRELEVREALRLLDEVDLERDRSFVGLGRDDFGVVSDEGGFDPVGTLIVGVEGEEPRFGVFDEFFGVCHGGRRGAAGGEEDGEDEEPWTHDFYDSKAQAEACVTGQARTEDKRYAVAILAVRLQAALILRPGRVRCRAFG